MRRKTEQKGLFSGLTFSNAMILFGILLAAGAMVGLLATKGVGPFEGIIEAKAPPPIRAVHIKPDLTKIKKQTETAKASEEIMMSPAMLRQVSLLEERIAKLEGHMRSLSKSNLDLAEKIDASGLDLRITALEDSLLSFTASIDKRMQQTAMKVQKPEAMNASEMEALPRVDEITKSERGLLPPPFKTDTPKDMAAQEPAPAPKTDRIEKARKEILNSLLFTDLSKPQIETPQKPASGWQTKVTMPKKPPQKVVVQKSTPRFTTEMASKETTGSIKRAAPKKPVKKKIAEKEQFAVHIASASTLYKAKDSWLELSRDNGILRNLTPHIVSDGVKKTEAVPWKLLAGPLATEDEAVRICTRLKAKGKFCRRTTLSGTPLKF